MQVGNKLFGVDIASLVTVLTPQLISSVPDHPRYVTGVTKLRGNDLSVIDLHFALGQNIAADEENAAPRIVVVEHEDVSAGLLADGIWEVIHLPSKIIEASHDSGFACVNGIVKIESIGRKCDKIPNVEQIIHLLDVAQMLELASVQSQNEFQAAA
jgi:chemotaxis signal transduction protein